MRKKVTLKGGAETQRLRTKVQRAQSPSTDVLRALDAIIWERDPKTLQFTFVSQPAEKLLGYPVESWLSDPNFWCAHLDPADADRALTYCRAEIKAGRNHELEYRAVAADGTVVWLRDRVRVLLDVHGHPYRCCGVTTAIRGAPAPSERAVLLEIAKAVSGTSDLHQMLERVLRCTTAVLPCERVVTYYWEPTRGTFRNIAQYGLPEDLAREAAEVEFGAGHAAVDLLASGQTMLINDVTEQHWVPPSVLAHFGITAALAVPLAVRGRILGALVAINTTTGRFQPAQVQLFESIASHVALALETTDLYQTQREEAQIAAALARVGQEMISSLDTPVILERLCQLTTEVLPCDCSHTMLWDEREAAYVPVSGFGDTAEGWEALRSVTFPRAAVADLMARLQVEDVMQVVVPELPEHPMIQIAGRYGFTVCMYVALRRGRDMIGYQAARLRARLEPFSGQQQRLFRGIGQIASLALANAQLVEELARASRIKSDFVATMSHELRTPLNVILGYNDLLLDGAFGQVSREQQEILRRIEQSGRELLAMVNTALDLTRLDAGRLPVDVQPVDIAALLAEIAGDLQAVRERSGLELTWQMAGRLPVLHTDPTKLKVILKNLIANALKFTDAGCVSVSAATTSAGVEFSVTDTGIGIPREAQPFIFEAFRQGDSSMTRRHGGVGLGLYIVRRLVDVLGGAIAFETEVGRGSTFRVALPLKAPRRGA